MGMHISLGISFQCMLKVYFGKQMTGGCQKLQQDLWSFGIFLEREGQSGTSGAPAAKPESSREGV